MNRCSATRLLTVSVMPEPFINRAATPITCCYQVMGLTVFAWDGKIDHTRRSTRTRAINPPAPVSSTLRPRATPKEVEPEINSSLKPGDSADKMEAYFENEGLVLSYDRFQGRYHSIIRHPESNFHAITIVIFVDEKRRFIRAEADDSYTFL